MCFSQSRTNRHLPGANFPALAAGYACLLYGVYFDLHLLKSEIGQAKKLV